MEFERMAAARFVAGRAERGLSMSDPFQGDPAKEFCEEMADGRNYAIEMRRQGLITEEAFQEKLRLLKSLWIGGQTAGRESQYAEV